MKYISICSGIEAATVAWHGMGWQPLAFTAKDSGADASRDVSPTMRAMGHSGSHANGGWQLAVAFKPGQSASSRTLGESREVSCTLLAGHKMAIQQAMQVRRLTPTECERLQGFPDHYTDVTYRKKPAADGPRYKALGNSMAVPCMAWIGYRIEKATRGNI